MKSLIIGAMLLRTLNAQIGTGTDASVPTATDGTVAPVLTPGIDAPSESELLGSPRVMPLLLDLEPSFSLPGGTADVVLPQATPAPLAAGSSPGVVTNLGPDQFGVQEADDVSVTPVELAPLPTDTDVGTVDTITPLPLPVPTDTDTEIGSITPLPLPNETDTAVPTDTDVVTDITPLPLPDVSNTDADTALPTEIDLPTETPTDIPSLTGLPIDVPTETPTGTTTVIETATETTTVTPTESATETDTGLPTEVTPTGDGTPTPSLSAPYVPTGIAQPIGSNPYVGPYDPYSPYDPNSPYYDPQAQPPYWEGNDVGNYDGEDQGKSKPKPEYDSDEEECPSWCIPDDDSYDSYPGSDSYDSYPTSDSYEPYATADAYNPYPTSDEYSPYKPEPTPDYPEYSPTTDAYPEYPETTDYEAYPQQPTYTEEPYPAPSPSYGEEPQYYPEPEPQYPQLRKVRSILSAVRRQVYSWGQPSYDDDDDSQYDAEGDDAPAWIWNLDNAPKKPGPKPKPTCPAICYKAKPGYGHKPARPTYTKTRKPSYQPTDAPYGNGNSSVYVMPTGGSTDIPVDSTAIPTDQPTDTAIPTDTAVPTDTATAIPTEPTGNDYYEPTSNGYYEPTTLLTQYQPAVQTGYESYNPGYDSYDDGYSSSNPGSPPGDYTGDTLDSICPNVCNPFNPAENFCDITTGCTTTGGSKYYCACRAGFRADDYNEKDFSKQFKVSGQPYVYLAVRTSCNTPCKDQTCSEVMTRDQCK